MVFKRNGKGGKERDVYLDKELVKHLKKYLEIKKKNKYKKSSSGVVCTILPGDCVTFVTLLPFIE